jgi:hypothetical protein
MSQRVAEGVCACFQGFVCMNLFPQKWSVYLTRPIGGGHGLPGCKVYEVSKIGQAGLRLRGVWSPSPPAQSESVPQWENLSCSLAVPCERKVVNVRTGLRQV